MVSRVSRKRKSVASESESSFGTQDTVLMKFDTLCVSSLDDSWETTQMFKKPCTSIIQEVPGANVAESVEETFLPSSLSLVCIYCKYINYCWIFLRCIVYLFK